MKSTPAVERHFDNGKTLSAFADEVWVRCNRCEHPGVVTAQWQPYCWTSARFACGHCALLLLAQQGAWKGPVELEGRRRCQSCGHKWVNARRTLKRAPQHPAAAITSCPSCGCLTSVDLPVVRHSGHAGGVDPHFGLPLYLTDALRLGVLWAYNARHLQALKAYVQAGLRERSGMAGNRAMFSRLPLWIKQARHRDEVGRSIARLEALLTTGRSR